MRTGFLVLLAALAAFPSRAGLIGTEVTLNYTFNGIPLITDVFRVTPGLEINCAGHGNGSANVCSVLSADRQNINVGDFSITYNYIGQGAAFGRNINGFDFEGLDPGGPITSVILLTAGITGLDPGHLHFTANSIQLDMSYVFVNGPQSSFTLEIGTAVEPATLLLMLPLLAALFIFRAAFAAGPAAPASAYSGSAPAR